MALIPYADPDALDAETRRAVQSFEQEHQRPSMGRRMLANYPPALFAMDVMHDRFMNGGQLSRRTKELLFVAAAQVRGCRYSMGGHSRYLVQHFGLDPETVVRLRRGEAVAGWDPVDLALIRFARRAAADPEAITDQDVDLLVQEGLNPAAVMEALSMVMLSAVTHTLAATMKFADDLEEWGLAGEYF